MARGHLGCDARPARRPALRRAGKPVPQDHRRRTRRLANPLRRRSHLMQIDAVSAMLPEQGDHMSDEQKYVAKGSAHVKVPVGGQPLSVPFVWLPKSPVLAFFPAIDPRRRPTQLTKRGLFRWKGLWDDGLPV